MLVKTKNIYFERNNWRGHVMYLILNSEIDVMYDESPITESEMVAVEQVISNLICKERETSECGTHVYKDEKPETARAEALCPTIEGSTMAELESKKARAAELDHDEDVDALDIIIDALNDHRG
ncbi:hypothetical protein [Moritella sp. F3]|uniref:hypothetical protein n=1 Tax=Moritella sp. F3 TaxID=2718882 RepID=UPI0018E1B1FA|nr:hypothetical protein [Moritella sp. F3]GIC77671.1 hypothetical protein FMO001_23980 [Moritella sp. F1]GIC82084.1 hypothetical protein FMO003_23650 [Moritella sp. F3]